MKKLLENEIIRLRQLEISDLEYLFKWENDTSLWQYTDTLMPLSRDLLKKYIENLNTDILQTKQIRLIAEIKQEKQQAGIIDLYDIDFINNNTAIGIMIDSNHRNRGIGKSILEMAADYAFLRLGLHQIHAYISVDNAISIKLFESCGFKKSGTLKEWRRNGAEYVDVHIYQLLNTN